MEPALKTFLDGLHEQDNIVSLDRISKPKAPPAPPVRNDNSSGMLDMRAMAKRYQEMSSAGAIDAQTPAPVEIEASLISQMLAPIQEEAPESHVSTRFIASLAVGALLLIALTAVVTAIVTATVVRRSVRAEMAGNAVAAVPAVATESMMDVAPADMDEPEALDAVVAEPAEVLPALADEASVSEEEHASDDVADEAPSMHFEENEVPAHESRSEEARSRDEEKPMARSEKREASEAPATTRPQEPREEKLTSEEKPQAAAPAAAETASAQCDEVLCLLEGKGCCGKAASVKKPSVDEGIDTSLPEDLSRSDISEGLAPISGRLNSCGVRAGLMGATTFKLKISAEGRVQSASTQSGDDAFRACAETILKKAKFAKTQRGASLSYPVIFR